MRSSGILLHPTSLPGRFGIGDFGPEAYRFADTLAEAGQRLWQMLPLGPPGYGDSPYALFSAFAGNRLLISPETLAQEGWLDSSDLVDVPPFPEERCDFGWVIQYKVPLLRHAFENFRARATRRDRADLDAFCRQRSWWLDDYARFRALKDVHGGVEWTRWSTGAQPPDDAVEAVKFYQFCFFRQFSALKDYCRERGIRLMGDVPIYVSHDSADVWAHPELFCLRRDGRPEKVAGVPPDYFSATGQLWGNPIYRWDRLAETGYQWWIDRLRASFEMFDLVRLDHFRGFEAYWEVPAGETTAIQGQWVKGPGEALFAAAGSALGKLPIVAENLGVITPEVEALRNRFGFPGMAVLQFAFGTDPQAPTFRPHNYPRHVVAYTGTHDNDTTVGWWTPKIEGSTRSREDIESEHQFARDYLNLRERDEINWTMIRTLMGSVADTVLAPLQDVLGLGSQARMNLPASQGGNWQWRFRREQLTAEHVGRLRRLAALYDR